MPHPGRLPGWVFLSYLAATALAMRKAIYVLLLTGWCIGTGYGQTFYLRNASFEGEPADATVPVSWLPCQRGTTPDILPGVWGVYQEPSEGHTYVGLITRDDGSWESIGQRLPGTLPAHDCYTFNIDLAHSRTYAGYNRPIKLRIWGGATKCQKDQLLYESNYIDHLSWKTYTIEFTLKKPINYLLLEAFYSEDAFSHRGNVLIDNISAFRRCPRADAGSGDFSRQAGR